MSPSEVRDHILREHSELFRLLDRLEKGAGAGGRPERAADKDARRLAQALCREFFRILRREAELLAPALRAADAWGEARAARLRAHHDAERRCLMSLIRHVWGRQPATVAPWRHDLARLRRELRDEDAELLRIDVLRDDVVGIAVECS